MLAVNAYRELRGPRPRGTIVVDGAPALAPVLARELAAGGNPAAVREGGTLAGATLLVWVGEADEARLRAASRARVPIVAVSEAASLPYVLATDLIRLRAGAGFPLEEIGAAIGRRSARPRPRSPPTCRRPRRDRGRADPGRLAPERLIAAAIFVPGADLPVLTLNQVRLVARIASAHGKTSTGARGVELLGVVGAGFGFRALARTLAPVRAVRRLRGEGRVRLRRHARGRRGRPALLRRARLSPVERLHREPCGDAASTAAGIASCPPARRAAPRTASR